MGPASCEDLLRKARITSNGAVLLGRKVACDAHEPSRPVRVVTHAHNDHIGGLSRSLRECSWVLMTEATRDLLSVLKRKDILRLPNVVGLKYNRPFDLGGEVLTLVRARHIIGAAQVLVEDEEGTRLLYTGDFKFPGTPVVEADVLVMEATYGRPGQVRDFEPEVEERLVELVRTGLREGPVYIFGYHGKLQEVMQILVDGGIWAPFVLPPKVYEVTRVCERYGMIVGDYVPTWSDEARELVSRGEPYVAFYHTSSYGRVRGRKAAMRITVSGWELSRPVREVSKGEFVVGLSDHADFEGLLAYVEECGPKLVITDNYRMGSGAILAEEIRRRLGVPAFAMPSRTPIRRDLAEWL
ncbi:hypothetical protein DRO33_02010 [Candidatus Bathyarchaeota archaeon]|nr:MAG: hypothetical protein DRO33_02010 [Candidatus Bathyarchaeota archaeon]